MQFEGKTCIGSGRSAFSHRDDCDRHRCNVTALELLRAQSNVNVVKIACLHWNFALICAKYLLRMK